MTSVFPGNGDPISTVVVSKTSLGPAIPSLSASIPPSLLNPPKTSTAPPSTPGLPAKPLTSATLLTTAINNAIASKRTIPNVVQQGVPNFHSAYLANNSYQMTRNGVVKQSTFIDAPMSTNALPQATVKPTIAPTIAPTLPPPSEEDTPDYTNYFYIAGGILIVLFIFSKK